MITGDTVVKLLKLETLAGQALSYADKTAFQAGGWDITWRDTSGTALSSQPTWTISDEGSGWHRVVFTVPSGVSWAEPTVPGWANDVPRWGQEGQTYDEDSIAGLLQTSQGVPTVTSAADGDLGDVVMGDSWCSPTVTVPLGKISCFGYTDLSGMTLTGGLKQDPSTTAVTGTSTTSPNLYTTIVSVTDRTVTAAWITFPTAMNLGATASDLGADWFLDFQLKHTASGRIITPLRYKLRVVWQRDTTT